MHSKWYRELFGNSDSEDGEFSGFEDDDLNNNDVGPPIATPLDDIELTEEDLRAIREEIDMEERDPALDLYEHGWLTSFTPIYANSHQ